MKEILFLLVGFLLLQPGHCQSALSPDRIPVILDTDMDSDVDDVGALAMLHAYEKAGKVKILAVIVTSDEKYSAPCVEAINTYFGRSDIPIGVSQRDSLKVFSRYTEKIADEFPHQLMSNATAESSTTVYRRVLANQANGGVVIITIGHLTSLSRLLNSEPDSISPHNGLALIAKKVKAWSCMGGQFPAGKEANFYRPDPASTVDCLAKWALPVTFSGWEVGEQIVTGRESYKALSKPSSPVYKGYDYYNGFKGRASWDQIAVLEAIEGNSGYFEIDKNGYCKVTPDGSNEWRPFASHFKHGYVKIVAPREAIQKRIEDLMNLADN